MPNPNIVDRHRGGVVHAALITKRILMADTDAGTSTAIELTALVTELNKFREAPLAIAETGAQTSADPVYTAPGELRTATLNDSGLQTARGTVDFWLEDTAGALIDPRGSGFALGTATGGAANVLVLMNSTDVLNTIAYGKVISNSTGNIAIAFSSTGTSTARLFYRLPSGLTVAGSTLIFD